MFSISHASLFTNLIASYEIGDGGLPIDPRDLALDPNTISDLELALYYLRYRCSIIAASPFMEPIFDDEASILERVSFPRPVKIEKGVPVDPRLGDDPVNMEEIASFLVCQHAYLRALGQNVDYTQSATNLISSFLPDYQQLSSSECSDGTFERHSSEYDDRLSLSWSYYCDEIKEYNPHESLDFTDSETFYVGRQPVRLFNDYYNQKTIRQVEGLPEFEEKAHHFSYLWTEPAEEETQPPIQIQKPFKSKILPKKTFKSAPSRHSVGSCSWEDEFYMIPFSPPMTV